jgi:hypothetical protein
VEKRSTTTLVTLTLRASSNKDTMAARITTEIGTASSIKCKHTQKDVRTALKRLKAFLQRLSTVPDTGVAIFASANDVIGVVPDAAIDHNDYICGKTFHVEPIQHRFRRKTDLLYGWCLLTGSTAEYSDSSGEAIRKLTRPGGKQKRHTKGGQSAPRFQRMFDAADAAWTKQLGVWLQSAVRKGTQHVFIGGGIHQRQLVPHLGAAPEYSLHIQPFDGNMGAWTREVQLRVLPAVVLAGAAQTARDCRRMLETSPDTTCVGVGPCHRAVAEGMAKQLWVEKGQEWDTDVPTILLPAGALAELGGAVAELHYAFDWNAIVETE